MIPTPILLTLLDLACALSAAALFYLGTVPWPITLAIALIPWALRWLATGRPSRRTPFDLPLALFLACSLLAVFVAFDRAAAWSRFWLILGGVILCYALANAAGAPALRLWVLSLLGLGIAVTFVLTHDWTAPSKIGLLTRLGLAIQSALPRLPALDSNANIGGSLLALLLPFSAAALLDTLGRLRRSPGAARLALVLLLLAALWILAITSLGLVLTASRGAWAALLGALALAALYALTGCLARGSHLRHGLYLALVLLLLLASAAAVILLRPALVARLLDALPGPSAVGARTDLWRGALTLIRDYPFTGLGHDGFMMAYSTYVMQLHVGFAPHAHNLFLDLAVEQGLPSLLLFLALALIFFLRFWRRPSTAAPNLSLGAAAIALLVILLHGLVDDPLYTSRAVLFLFIPLAFAVPAAPQPGAIPVATRSSRRLAWAVPALFLLALAAALFLARAPVLSALYTNLDSMRQSRVELSVYSWPRWPIQDELRRQLDLQPAIAAFQRALVLAPANPSAARRLGQIELSLGDYAPALAHLETAYAGDPSPTARALLAEALFVSGDRSRARALWSTLPNDAGQLAARIWWYEHLGRQDVARAMQAALP